MVGHSRRGTSRVGRFSTIVSCGMVLVPGVAMSAPVDDPPVQVIVDMDLSEPGFQHLVRLLPSAHIEHTAAVYILDPLGTRELWGIGYLGGIDRGISFGHMPTTGLVGSVTAMVGTPGTPANPGNTPWVDHAPAFEPGFVGPEVHYLEHGATASAPILASPAGPVFTVQITVEHAVEGDRFSFYLLDFVRVWQSGGTHGAFSTQAAMSLDTGGDAVPDGTWTIHGGDPDVPIPVPPASYAVDFIDGPPATGPAVIEIFITPGDINLDGVVDVLDLLLLLAAWGPCPQCPEDLNGDGLVDVQDLLILLANWT